MCDSAEDSNSTFCPHDKLALKAKCGHTQRQSSDAGGRGRRVCGVSGKKKSVAYLCHHGNAPCDSTCPSCESRPSLDPLHSAVRQIRRRWGETETWERLRTLGWSSCYSQLDRLGEVGGGWIWTSSRDKVSCVMGGNERGRGAGEQNLSTAVCQMVEPRVNVLLRVGTLTDFLWQCCKLKHHMFLILHVHRLQTTWNFSTMLLELLISKPDGIIQKNLESMLFFLFIM